MINIDIETTIGHLYHFRGVPERIVIGAYVQADDHKMQELIATVLQKGSDSFMFRQTSDTSLN